MILSDRQDDAFLASLTQSRPVLLRVTIALNPIEHGKVVTFPVFAKPLPAGHKDVYSPEMGDIGDAAKRLSIPLWGRLLIAALALVVAGAGTSFITIFVKLGKMNAALLTLASKQPAETKDLVKELLSQAWQDVTTGHIARAEKALSISPVLLATATKQRTPAAPEFFKSSITTLDELQSRSSSVEIAEGVRGVRIILAQYRSALEVAKPLPTAAYYVLPKEAVRRSDGFRTLHIDNVRQAVVDLREVPPGVSALVLGPPGPPGIIANSELPVFVINGTQRLDGLTLINVVFSNMLIKYSGGPITLQNVKFVDCRFEFSVGANPDALADYVALDLPSLKVRG